MTPPCCLLYIHRSSCFLVTQAMGSQQQGVDAAEGTKLSQGLSIKSVADL